MQYLQTMELKKIFWGQNKRFPVNKAFSVKNQGLQLKLAFLGFHWF